MKPKFALDLSHEGINLLHRSKGGWTLVGSVALDDPEMGTHLAQIRRKAAELESGGFTCKIIIPNSQVLYTTVEAPGPDDIAREVQIRSGLDGLTPYPVGELVFDWRAAGERARIAVLARDTMDEAETFAVEHKFNPVPRRARAIEPAPASDDEARAAEARIHQPPGVAPAQEGVARSAETQAPEPPAAPPIDDQFAELDAIAAELSGDPDAAPPAFRSHAARKSAPGPRADRGTRQPIPPPLAPFPPTSDDPETMPAPQPQTRKSRPSGKSGARRTGPKKTAAAAPKADPAKSPAPEAAAPPARSWTPPETKRPAALDTPLADTALPEDDTPARPGVAFSSRRAGAGAATTATPAARRMPANQPAQGAAPAPTPPASGTGRKHMSPSDRRRADMAEALSRPLPGSPATPETAPEPRDPGAESSEAEAKPEAGRGAGFRSFGQRRAARKEDPAQSGSSMAELMRGAGSSEARISPDQNADEPDLLAPDVAAADSARAEPDAPRLDAETVPVPAKSKPTVAPEPSVEDSPTPASAPPPTAPAPKPAQPAASEDKRVLPAGPASEAEALTVFGARRTAEKRGGRKYLGVALTLLLLLLMAIIALWSSFFVEDPDTALFNPSEDAVPLPEAAPAPAPDTPPADVAPAETAPAEPAAPDAAPVPGEDLPADTASDATTPAETGTPPTPQVLTPEEAEARYIETQIWQRAPETLAEPRSPGLDIGEFGGPGVPRADLGESAATVETPPPSTAPLPESARAAPLPPPPADTVFELDETGLVSPSPDGTVSPTGIIVYQGAPPVLPPVRPAPPALPEVTPEAATPDDAALEQAVEEALEEAAAAPADAPPLALPDEPDTRPLARPDDLPAPDAAAPETTVPDAADPAATGPDDARLDSAPAGEPADPASETAAADVTADPAVELAAADAASIAAAVDAVATSFVDATELAVEASIKPTHRPANIDQIANAAAARAAAAPPAPAAPATTTPAIPTSASVASQATTPNALDLREINLLGISGPSNARRALVRMSNGRYVTVKVGDRLDGGRVTSITDDGLTYQKGSRSYALQLLPLG